jgi:replicative DNA helicase
MNQEELEKQILHKFILNPEAYYNNHELVKPDLFVDEFNKEVFIAFKKLVLNGETPDIIKLKKFISTQNSAEKLAEIISRYDSFNESLSIILALNENEKSRRLQLLINHLNNSLKNKEDILETLDFAKIELDKINDLDKSGVVSMNDRLENLTKDIKIRSKTKGLLGITTGFQSLDNFTGGWQKTDLIIIGGASSMGKTSFALNLAFNAAKNNINTVVFSYEMGAIQLMRRLVAAETGVSSKWMSQGLLGKDDMTKVEEGIEDLKGVPLFIDECNKTSLTYLSNKIKQYALSRNVKLILVDYLQLVTAGSSRGTREQEVSKIARTLKNLARELNITIIALSQLNRRVTARDDSTPTLADLRESGEIEQASDIVILLYRPEYYGKDSEKGLTKVIFAKGRNIGVGIINMIFNNELTKFKDYEKNN